VNGVEGGAVAVETEGKGMEVNVEIRSPGRISGPD
jgi:hypothetical protein